MFIISDNTPSAGCIQWSNLHMQYLGVTYTIQDGYTNYPYVYWNHSTPTQLVVSNTLPANLTDADCLLFLNKSGIHLTVPTATILDGDLLVPGSVMANALAANSVTANAIAAGAVTANAISAGAITANALSANCIGASAIAASAITSDKIVSSAITSDKLAANSVTANAIASNTITADKLAAGTITSSSACIGSLKADWITTGTLDAKKITVANLSASSINTGTLTGITLNSVTIDASDTLTIGASSGSINPALVLSTAAAGSKYTSTLRAAPANPGQTEECHYVDLVISSSDNSVGKGMLNISGYPYSNIDVVISGDLATDRYLGQTSSEAFNVGSGNCKIDCTGGIFRVQADSSNYISVYPSGSGINGYVGGANVISLGSSSSVINNVHLGSGNHIWTTTSSAIAINYYGGETGGLNVFNGAQSSSGYGPIHCSTVTCSGSKPALVTTEHYDEVYMFSEECPTPQFTDRGHGVIGENGLCYIFIDDKFVETVTTSQSDYYIQLTGYSGANAEINDKEPNYFIVSGVAGKGFDWQITADRKGYERLRYNDAIVEM